MPLELCNLLFSPGSCTFHVFAGRRSSSVTFPPQSRWSIQDIPLQAHSPLETSPTKRLGSETRQTKKRTNLATSVARKKTKMLRSLSLRGHLSKGKDLIFQALAMSWDMDMFSGGICRLQFSEPLFF